MVKRQNQAISYKNLPPPVHSSQCVRIFSYHLYSHRKIHFWKKNFPGILNFLSSKVGNFCVKMPGTPEEVTYSAGDDHVALIPSTRPPVVRPEDSPTFAIITVLGSLSIYILILSIITFTHIKEIKDTMIDFIKTHQNCTGSL